MKIAACLKKSLLSDAERQEVMDAYQREVKARGGGDSREAEQAAVKSLLSEAEIQLRHVEATIARQQAKATPTKEKPSTEADRYALGLDIDVKASPAPVDEARLASVEKWFEPSRVPPVIPNSEPRAAKPSEQKTIVSMMYALRDLGVPTSILSAITGTYVMDVGPMGSMRVSNRSIGFRASFLRAVGKGWDQLRIGVAAHEVHHALDSNDDGTFQSTISPLFDLDGRSAAQGVANIKGGPLVNEAARAVMKTQDDRLRMLLLYPLNIAYHAKNDPMKVDLAKAELFAQLGRLYFTNPELMKAELPTSYDFFKGLNDEQAGSGSLSEAREILSRHLQGTAAAGSVRDNDAGRNDRGNGAGTGVGQARSGMGAGARNVAAGAVNIEPSEGLDRPVAQKAEPLTEAPPGTPRFGDPVKDAISVVGVHYGPVAGLDTLRGDKYGTGAAGAEKSRVKWASDDRVKKRVYFYAQSGKALPKSEGLVSGAHAYRVQLNNIYDLATDKLNLRERYSTYGTDQFHNETWLESQILNAGYDGYLDRSFSPSPAVVVLNKDVPVEYLGNKVAEKELAIDSPSIDAAASVEAALKIAKSRVWARGRDLKQAMQDAITKAAEAAGVNLESHDERTFRYLVRAAVLNAKFALKQNPNAVGWYDEKTRQAIAVMALVHPEIATDENAKFAFVWALAVTSNGQRVDSNFTLAERAYSVYKETGRMPTNLTAGNAQKAINKSLGLFNTLRMAWGIDNLRNFMQTEFTVGEIAAISQKLKPGGEHVDVSVKGSAILGPKIGNGFFSNLYGDFRALTMDRWLIRTWGRWTGTLIKDVPELTAEARDRMKEAIADLNKESLKAAGELLGVDMTASPDDISKAVQKHSMFPEKRRAMNQLDGGELRKAGNSLAKYLDGQKEAPSGPVERKFIRRVFTEALAELRQDPAYSELTMADLQAVLWYAEKRLYETAKDDALDGELTEGYTDSEAPDYANAASAVAREKGVSERRIKLALNRESNSGRAGNARPASAGVGPQGTPGQQGKAGGFARRDRGFFLAAQAVDKARSNRVGDDGQPRTYERERGEAGRRLRVLRQLGVTYIEVWRPASETKRAFGKHGLETPNFVELEATNDNAQRFADLITASKAGNPYGAAVYVYPAADYQKMRLFISRDGLSGVAVKEDGDVVSLFSTAGGGRAALELALSNGGRKLDAFETVLPYIYGAHGFVATSRVKWDDSQAPAGWDKKVFAEYNNGEPDVVFMVFDPRYRGDHRKGSGILYEGPDAYGNAVAEQGRGIKRVDRGRQSRPKYSISDGGTASDVASIRSRVDRLTAGWARKPDVIVLEKPSEAPFPAPANARGAFHEGSVYLFASNLAGDADTQFTLLHEAAGHLGLRGVLGEAFDATLQRIYDTNESVRTLAGEQMAKYGYDQATATEEALADLAGSGKASSLTGWKMFVASLRNLLRKAGLSVEMSDNDVLALLAGARRYAEGNVGAKGEGFSQKGPLWYSELASKLAAIPMKVSPAAQWQNTIRALKGVKPDEIEWSGVNDWLATQSGKVTKEQVLEYLRQNGVQVKEVMYGANDKEQAYLEASAAVDRAYDAIVDRAKEIGLDDAQLGMTQDLAMDNAFAPRLVPEGMMEVVLKYRAAVAEWHKATPDRDIETRYGSYTLPGGKNYRELLLTLPPKRPLSAANRNGLADDLYGVPWSSLSEFEKGEVDKAIQSGKYSLYDTGMRGFRSAHWDEANILAHIRFNERTDADGKRVLFVEEIQSDWAQKGKKEGFDQAAEPMPERPTELPAGWIVKEYAGRPGKQQRDAILAEHQRVVQDLKARDLAGSAEKAERAFGENWTEMRSQWALVRSYLDQTGGAVDRPLSGDPEAAFNAYVSAIRAQVPDAFDGITLKSRKRWGVYSDSGHLQAADRSKDGAINEALEVVHRSNVLAWESRKQSSIPSAPFVGKTDSWVALAIKRMIRYAAENGFDRVAFINGEQSAERYDLSKHVDSISYRKNNDGTVAVRARDFDGHTSLWANDAATENDIEEALGKEIAKKILEGGEKGTLRDLDLKVGGEGMKAFYDSIVPKVAKEALKKLGGSMTEVSIERSGLIGNYDPLLGDANYWQKQIGFDITDEMREMALGGMPLFSRGTPAWVESMSPEYQAAAKKVSILKEQETFKQKMTRLFSNSSLKLAQGLVDQFAPVKELSERAYVLLRMTKSSDAGVEALLHYGKPKMTDAGGLDIDYEQGGLVKILQQLGGEQQRFFAWIAGNRAEQLKREGKENLLTADDISALKDSNQGNMPDGSSRAMLYARVHREFQAYSKSVLDVAEKAGIINGPDRAIWERDFYVPFYRITEDEGYSGPKNVSGVVNQYAFKKLRGGTQNIGDLLENSLRNWGHLLAASLKNRAAAETLRAAENAMFAYPISQHEAGKGDPFILVEGRKQYYRVEDPFLLDAISALDASPFSGTIPKVMGKFKHALTLGVTISPTFRVRNLIRDSLQAISTNEMTYNVGKNIVSGWKGSKLGSEEYGRMLVSGGLMHFGTALEGDYAEHVNRLINAGVEASTVVDSHEKVKAMLSKAWDWWSDTGSKFENVTRIALYQQTYDRLIADGASQDEARLMAAYAARDSMDFSMQGAWPAVRLLTQVVPFLNARAQGMYKLGREGVAPTARVIYNTVTGHPVQASDIAKTKRFSAVVGAVALASIALFLKYRDDDDWKQREEYDRDTFWWFKVGDVAYRIPKPFEVGALGSVAERGLEMMMDGMDAPSRERFAKRMWEIVMSNLSMDPTPQMFKPMLEVYANTNSFTKRPIETMGMGRLSTSERIGPNTSAVAQLAGQAGILSPVQIDHLVQGYLGWLGAHSVMAVDAALRPAMGLPEKPARRLDEIFTVGDFAKELPAQQSRFLTEFYNQAEKTGQRYADLRHYQGLGRIDKVAELREEYGADIAAHQLFATAQKRMEAISHQIKRVQASNDTAESKREQITRLTEMRNNIARQAVETRQAATR
ncbi:MAG TPA: hypothetical protein P5153_17195 [Candidatus Krumholzibacteria bacterium]|nr:hypothetical protein [Candidatus Krumholzibacteria bacterium]